MASHSESRLRVDLHLHSNYSHDSQTSLEQLVERCREIGLDRIALTDHNTAEGALRLAREHPGLTIVAEEVRTTEGEVIGLFITETIPPWLRPEQVMDRIHAMGGLTLVVHPLDRRRAHFQVQRLVELADRIDIIETYNPWAEPSANAAAEQLAVELGKATAWSSDAHGIAELGQCWMEMDAYDGPADFLAKLREATPRRTPESGAARRW